MISEPDNIFFGSQRDFEIETASPCLPLTSRASALVMFLSVAARALMRLASRVGEMPGAEVSSVVYDSTNDSTLSAVTNSHRSVSGWHSRATCIHGIRRKHQCCGGGKKRPSV